MTPQEIEMKGGNSLSITRGHLIYILERIAIVNKMFEVITNNDKLQIEERERNQYLIKSGVA